MKSGLSLSLQLSSSWVALSPQFVLILFPYYKQR
jgi:hypothetical protein